MEPLANPHATSSGNSGTNPSPSQAFILRSHATTILWLAAIAGFYVFVWRFRFTAYAGEPLLNSYGEIAAAIVAFAFAGNALVRFRGIPDRVPLLAALGILLCGLIESGWAITIYRTTLAGGNISNLTPLAWFVPRAGLAILLLVALEWERRAAASREPRRELLLCLLATAAVFYFVTAASLAWRFDLHPRTLALLPGPWELVLAIFYLAATMGFWRRLAFADSVLGRSLWAAAVCMFLAQLCMSQSRSFFDALSSCAHLLKDFSYLILLAGSLAENGRLFNQLSQRASSDPLTGLANHWRLVDVMQTEIERSRRTNRPFAILLLDMDNLKPINDQYGHLVGSHALKRLARVLLATCRSGDTAARYGGDEFALVLPETGEEPSHSVAQRIRERIAEDTQEPPFSASIGIAVFPAHGATVEHLLSAADAALYKMKAGRGRRDRGTGTALEIVDRRFKSPAAMYRFLAPDNPEEDEEKNPPSPRRMPRG